MLENIVAKLGEYGMTTKSKFCSLLDEGIVDEHKAPPFYEKLKNACLQSGTSQVLCKRLLKNKGDEERHYRILVDLKKRRCLRR